MTFTTSQKKNYPYRYDHGEECKRVGQSPDRRGRLYVTRTDKGWVWYCHNCNQKGFRSYTSSDVVAMVGQVDDIIEDTYVEPYVPGGYNFSKEMLDWMRKYIDDKEIGAYDISCDYTKLYLPIYNYEGAYVGYNARNFGEGPKYITHYFNHQDRDGSWFANNLTRSLIVTEDILSAIKCRRVSNSVALLSSPPVAPSFLLRHVAEYDKIFIWFDPDKQATSAVSLLRHISSHVIRPVNLVISEGDPKDFSTNEIFRLTIGR